MYRRSLQFSMENIAGSHVVYRFRPKAGTGLWCAILLPLSLLTSLVCYKEEASEPYRIATILSQEMLALSAIISSVFTNKLMDRGALHTGLCLICAVFGAVVLCTQTQLGFLLATATALSTYILFQWLSLTLPHSCPCSFSMGEVLVVSQGVTSFLVISFLGLLGKVLRFFGWADFSAWKMSDSTWVLQVALTGCALLFFLVKKFPRLRHWASFYLFFVGVAIFLMYPLCFLALGQEPVLWFGTFISASSLRTVLLLHTAVVTAVAVAFVAYWNHRNKGHASTVVRKCFHVLITIIYVPCILWDPEFLLLASGGCMAIFFLVECIRLLHLPPLGRVINTSLQIFLDEKDVGPVILTHMYLLVGCSIPLWIFPISFTSKGSHIALLSGILSLGFGDTAASIGGTLCGNSKWPGSSKSVEGTSLGFIVQLAATVIFYVLGGVHPVTIFGSLLLVFSTILNCLVEALTTQVDNLVLPLALYILLITL